MPLPAHPSSSSQASAPGPLADFRQIEAMTVAAAAVEAVEWCAAAPQGDLTLPLRSHRAKGRRHGNEHKPHDHKHEKHLRRSSTDCVLFSPVSDSPCSSFASPASSSRRRFDSRLLVPERQNTEISQRYAMDEQAIGAGGYGQVFVAMDRFCPGRTVAIKKLLRNGEKSAEAVRAEVSIMKDLDHPSICKLFETYTIGETIFFVIEYLEGGDMSEWLMEHKRLDEQTTAYIVRQVSNALRYAHGLGIAHRDMKPENVCFCSKDRTKKRVKVIDWGLGKYFCKKRMKSGVGSGCFMAPEVFNPAPEGSGYTSACDLWSLGVMTYVALSGKTPFWGSPLQIFGRMRDEVFPLAGGVWDSISVEAREFIRSCLRFEPEDRIPIKQLLQHPWLQEAASPYIEVDSDSFHEVLSNLEHFSHAPHFLSICIASVAKQLDHRSLDKLYRVFSRLDTEGDGYLSLDETYRGFAEAFVGFSEQPEVMAEFDEMFTRLDLDGRGSISWTEFCAAGIGESSYTQEHVLWAAFKSFDVTDNGRISCDDLKQVLLNADVNEIWSQDVCDGVAGHVMEHFAGDDGTIRFEDWLTLMNEFAHRHRCESPRRARRASTGSITDAAEPIWFWNDKSPQIFAKKPSM